MAKDPAFLFYPNDWLGGTLGMTLEEKGAYMEVLMLQFNRGHMEGHMIGQVVGQIWDKIKHKFVQDGNGLWYNERLETEKNNRKLFTDSRKNNLKGVNQYSKKIGHKVGHMTSHMEDENENINNNKNKVSQFFKDFPNSIELEDIARSYGKQKEDLLLKVEEFKKYCEISYPTYAKFVFHFKNWLNKNNTQQTPTKKRNALI